MYTIERGSPNWPLRLDHLDDPPERLWVVGGERLAFDTAMSVAMVGARASTAYGESVATEMAAGLVDRDYAVVSGGAYGIDQASHRGALANDGCTVVVLACGVDVAYPRAHADLFERIVGNGGYLVSEYPPGSAPNRGRFIQRNRIIAALAEGMVVVEAGLRSGSLNAARQARTLVRPVMAVPGPVTSVASEGTNQLIRNGARLVTSADDVATVLRQRRGY